MVKLLIVFGTRPEAIKMCPLVKQFRRRGRMEVRVCVTGQHREMLDQVLDLFGVDPEYDLKVMEREQFLFTVTSRVLLGMQGVLEEYRPDLVFVQGDTTTAFAASLACFYEQIPVAHVEAGLRTHDVHAPFPEEYDRQAIGLAARYHFAPTRQARDNLLREGKPEENIFVTGNTAIDALKTTVRADYASDVTRWARGSRLILMTAHRRENLGAPMGRMFRAVRRVVNDFPDVKVVYPMHPNPAVRQAAAEVLGGCERIGLIEPLGPFDFHNLMARAFFVLSDSGGVQEEAPALGKPVIVLRDTTERPEGLEAGTLRLVGTNEDAVYNGCRLLLENQEEYERMSRAHNPYGDGTASEKIADIVERALL